MILWYAVLTATVQIQTYEPIVEMTFWYAVLTATVDRLIN